MMIVNSPVKFQGSADEAASNRRTHHWVSWEQDETPECANCCAKTWHAAASYPCGVEPPRIEVTL